MSFTSAAKRHMLAGSAATALVFALSSGAHAQSADAVEDGDVVVATGIRQSIADSLNLKKNSSSIVEAITAEDIGKLPDVSIADSLARLPGVTAQRVRGRAQQISIRGLGPDFSIALLNGREQVSAGNNRGIEFDQFPSELVAKGVVYKSPDARLAATGIAGAVDLQTVKPLDYTERNLAASAKYVINDNGDLNPDFGADGYRLFGSYIDQNDDGTVGWSLGITHQSNPTQYTSRELKTGPGQIGTQDGFLIPTDNPRTGVVSRDFQRTSVAGALQFEPTDRFQATVDAYYSDSKDEGIFRGVETPLASWSGADVREVVGAPGAPFASGANYLTTPVVRTDTEGNAAEIFSIGANLTYQATEKLGLTADISTSRLDRNDIDYESYAGLGGAAVGSGNRDLQDSVIFTLPESGEYQIDFGRDYTDPNVVVLTDPGGWNQVGFIKEPKIEDELNQLRLEAEYDIDRNWVDSVALGGIYTDRKKTFDSNEAFLRPGTGWTQINPDDARTRQQTIPAEFIRGVTDGDDLGYSLLAYDPSDLIDNGIYEIDPAGGTSWEVEEDILTIYGIADLSFDFDQMPVTGNIGFQYIDVDQSSTGNLNVGIPNSTLGGEQTVDASYSDFLPSLNLSMEVLQDTFLRFAAAETVTRPRLDQLAANQGIGFSNQVCVDTDIANPDGLPDAFAPGRGGIPLQTSDACISVGGGNPLLQPYRSTNLDVSLEHYFSDAGAISVAFFTKSLSDYVLDVGQLIDVSDLESTSAVFDLIDPNFSSANAGLRVASLNTPVNAEDGTISGFEAAIRLPFSDFINNEFFGSFGTNISYSYTDSEIEDPRGGDVRIPGYSKNVVSGEVYFENYGFQGRVNTRYRDGFLSEIQQFDGSLSGAEALSEIIVDAQLGYEFEDGPLEGFSFNVEAYNLFDEPFATENVINGAGDTFVSRYERYGRTFNFTVAKKF